MNKKIIISVIIGVMVVVLIIIGLMIFNNKKNHYTGYQAVFLTNGQVYFGQITKINNEEINLNNIYYLQINKDLQSPKDDSTKEKDSDIALIKLGNELHGPKDLMIINREQVLFIENLKDNSKVIDAIKNYKNK